MNENTRNALEVLKRETLQVLYEQHINGIEYLGIKAVRELLGIPPTPGANCPNDMVAHFLLHLVEDGAVDYTPKNKYQITEKGISMIEGETSSAKEPTELQESIKRLDQLEEAVAFLISLYLEKGGVSTVIEFFSSAFHSGKLRNFKESVEEVSDVRKLINLLLKPSK